jgi:methionyl-tRNA formyltransferase
MLRVVFFGTPRFALPTLEMLLQSAGHQIVGVVTQPDRPSGRGQRMSEPPVKALAAARGIPVWQPTRLKDESFLVTVRALAPDIGVVAAYGRILPQVLLDIPRHGLLNVHASLLPRYRGASPVQRAVMNGDSETGVTIMRVVLALDAGPMLARTARRIGPDETSEDVEADLARMGARLLAETLDALEAGTAVEVAQDDRLATYAPRLTKEDGVVDWRKPAVAVHDHVRGLKPWPQAFSTLGTARVVVARGRPDETRAAGAEPGTVLEAVGDRFLVRCGEATTYQLLEVQPEGRRVMTAREFLNGHPVAPGSCFTLPPS